MLPLGVRPVAGPFFASLGFFRKAHHDQINLDEEQVTIDAGYEDRSELDWKQRLRLMWRMVSST